jgi:hypothetical protein
MMGGKIDTLYEIHLQLCYVTEEWELFLALYVTYLESVRLTRIRSQPDNVGL